MKSKYNKYIKEFKGSVVKEYLEDKVPIRQLAIKYNIPKSDTVRSWMIKYTEEEETRAYSPKPEVYKMMGIKKTYEEKIIIVEDFIENRLIYKEAAKNHQVNYNNIYS